MAKSQGKKIRSSIDLELQLGFEKNPLDKPSSDFRDMSQWFPKTEGDSASDQSPKETAKESTKEAYKEPKKERRSFFRSSLGSIHASLNQKRSSLKSTPVGKKRLRGPRNLNSLGNPESPVVIEIPKEHEELIIPVPPWYSQLRFWVTFCTLVSSLLAVILSGSVMSQMSNILAASSPFAFFFFVSLVTFITSAVFLVIYLVLPNWFLFDHDAPFLLYFKNESMVKKRPIVTYSDIILNSALVLFWVATLLDTTIRIGSCRPNSLKQMASPVCTAAEASISFGYISLIGASVGLLFKSWEVFGNGGAIRRALM